MADIKAAFIGLGVMGYPMAGHLQANGFATTVYNRSEEKALKWQQQHSGNTAPTPAAAAKAADIVFVCVGNDRDVRSVIYGEQGVLAGLKAGDILVDHTTTSATLAIELHKACLEIGVTFIDAPVSGGQAGAENGKLTVMCGGDQASFDKANPLMQAYAQQIQLLGENGQGQRCKMVNQICIAGILQGLSEALTLAQSAGLSIPQVVDTLKHGAAGSWQMENRLITMDQDKFDFGFALDWMRKDLGICLDEASSYQLELPLTKNVDERYAQLQAAGLGRMDTSALVKSLK
ncbi:MAG: NAD(P)-dependent oxidoreductase [Oceanospirillaceae bacterium]|nr:NAD(P)-dependent oxidoreductase [Oceanospirillaceae bacterium]